MPDRAAIDRGFAFEVDVAEALGLNAVSGSGNKPHDLSDVKGRLRISCKSTKDRTWAETLRQLAEAIDLAHGTGETPALAVEDPATGDRLLIFRLTDAAEALSYENRVERKPRRADVVKSASQVPTLLRDLI